MNRQRLDDELAQAALEQMIWHLHAIDGQLDALDAQLAEIARSDPWREAVGALMCFRGVSILTALSLLAEIGDFHRFGSARELMSFVGLTVSEYSSGKRRVRGSITKTGNGHVRRLLVEAAWRYRNPPRLSTRIQAQRRFAAPEVFARAWQAQIRLHRRHRHLTSKGKLSTVATVAVARELAGFLSGDDDCATAPGDSRAEPLTPAPNGRLALWSWVAGATLVRNLDIPMRSRMTIRKLATLGRGSSRPNTAMRFRPAYLRVTSRRCRRAGRPAPEPPP